MAGTSRAGTGPNRERYQCVQQDSQSGIAISAGDPTIATRDTLVWSVAKEHPGSTCVFPEGSTEELP